MARRASALQVPSPAFLLAVAILALAPKGRAQSQGASLKYEIDPTVAGCPSEAELRTAVEQRLGYDPFDGRPGSSLVARIRVVDTGLLAHIEARDPGGAVVGSRDVISQEKDCHELGQTMALAIAIAIDPHSAILEPAPARSRESGQGEPPPRPVAAVLQPPTAALPSTKPSPPSKQSVHPRLGIGAGVATGVLPAPIGWRVMGQGALKWSRCSLEIEASLFPRDVALRSEIRLTTSLWLATALGCFLRAGWFACARASGGALHGRAAVQSPRPRSTPYASLGTQAGVELPLTRLWLARVALHLDVPLWPTELQIDGDQVWTTPRLSGGLAGALVHDFF